MGQVYIIEAARTPVGKKNGALKDIHPVNLAAIPLRRTGATRRRSSGAD